MALSVHLNFIMVQANLPESPRLYLYDRMCKLISLETFGIYKIIKSYIDKITDLNFKSLNSDLGSIEREKNLTKLNNVVRSLNSFLPCLAIEASIIIL